MLCHMVIYMNMRSFEKCWVENIQSVQNFLIMSSVDCCGHLRPLVGRVSQSALLLQMLSEPCSSLCNWRGGWCSTIQDLRHAGPTHFTLYPGCALPYYHFIRTLLQFTTTLTLFFKVLIYTLYSVLPLGLLTSLFFCVLFSAWCFATYILTWHFFSFSISGCYLWP